MVEKNDLTQGSLVKMVFRFAVPFMAANMLQSIYGAVDLLVIGKYGSAASVAAVSTGTQVTQIITSLVSGLTLGSTVLIGHYVGKRDPERVKKVIGTTFSAFLMVALVLTAAMLLLQKGILTVLYTPAESFGLAMSYVSVCAWGNVFICEYNAVSAVLRGYGDSKRPLLFIGMACLLNIVLDIVFVKYFRLDVTGTALATVISQAVSMVTAVLYLRKKAFIFDFHRRSFKPQWDIVKKLLRIGVPVSFQELVIRISFLYIAFAMNSCGLYGAAIVGIGSKYDVFAMLTATSMAGALTAITAQNVGAGKPQRARKALWLCIGFSLTISCAFFLWAQLSPASMIGLFTEDEQIIAAGIPYFRSSSYDYLMVALVFCLNGYLNGKQKTVWTMLSSVGSALLLRIPMTYWFTARFPHQLGYIGRSAPLVSAVTALYTVGYVLMENRFSQKRQASGQRQ